MALVSKKDLYDMDVEDRGKDEMSALDLVKMLDTNCEDWTDTIRELGETARQLISENDPDRCAYASFCSHLVEKSFWF